MTPVMMQTIDQNISRLPTDMSPTLRGQLREDNQCDWHVRKRNDCKFKTSLLRVPFAFLEAAIRTLVAHIPNHHQFGWVGYCKVVETQLKNVEDQIGSNWIIFPRMQRIEKKECLRPPSHLYMYRVFYFLYIRSNPRFELMQWVARAPSGPGYDMAKIC